MKLALKKLLQANPSIQVSTLLSGSLSTPSAKLPFVPPNSFESIASFTITSTTANVTFSGIPQTYKDLHLRVVARESGINTGVGTAMKITLNGDTGNNYGRAITTAGGVGNASYSYSISDNNMFTGDGIVQGGGLAGTFGCFITEFYDYASTTIKKSVRTIGGGHNNSTKHVKSAGNIWNNTDAITSILIYPETNQFAAGSMFALYGIKAE